MVGHRQRRAQDVALVFSAISGDFADASKPRLTTGPDGSLLVFRYTTPDIVGTAGQLTEGGSRTEAIALPPEFDERRGTLTVQLDPSLAAGMQDGLDYLEHFEYECTEQTVSRFLPNVLTYNALQSLGIENPELAERLPGLIEEGLGKLYLQQNPDGGWGWWYNVEWPRSNAHVSGYVVFALLKAQQAGFTVESRRTRQRHRLPAHADRGRRATTRTSTTPTGRRGCSTCWPKAAPRPRTNSTTSTTTAKSSATTRAPTWRRRSGSTTRAIRRLATLLSDLNNAAILSATGAHWEEHAYDWWAMNTDTRSTAIVLDTLAKLDPENELIPNAVRWLMVARRAGIWETTQETAWALIALTDWMVETGELDADYDYAFFLNDVEQATAPPPARRSARACVTVIPVADLLADMTNALTIARTDGNGRLYYTAHLEVYQPVESVEPADRGIIVQRRYTLASCEARTSASTAPKSARSSWAT